MKNIIFDLGGVLIKGTPISILENIETKEYKEISKFFDNWEKLDLGKETLEQKLKKCKIPKKIENKYKDKLLEYYKYRIINQDLINLIKKLKHNNYKIYILSDNNKEAYNYYKNNKNFKQIDGWIISCEYNTIKKEGKLFEILLDKYKLKKEECYFIDNNEKNIKTAQKYQIKGIKFEESKINLLYEDMKKHKINL